jgi:replication-associated recombination protein RarA
MSESNSTRAPVGRGRSIGQLHEQYRPASWSDVVGQDRVLNRIAALRQRGLTGRAYWITGASGTGKSTIAHLIAGEVADPFGVEEIDAESLTPSRVVELERSSFIRGMGDRAGRAIIINESHGLRKSTVRQLLVTLERVSPCAVWLFTTTTEGQETLFEDCEDAHPLLSRCAILALARQGLAKPFAERARAIAIAEGLDGGSADKYLALVQRHKNNLRAVLQSIESGEMLAAA